MSIRLLRVPRSVLVVGLILLAISLAQAGTLKVSSFPSGADVWIDGANTGRLTPTSVSLPSGVHVVRVQARGSGWNFAEASVTVGSGISEVSLTLSPTVTPGPPGPAGPEGPPGLGVNPMQVALLRWYSANETGIDLAVGWGPICVAFDGAHIWVSRQTDPGELVKIRASDSQTVGNFGLGRDLRGVAFDGANIWVASARSNEVFKVRASDGAVLGAYTVGNGPSGVAFDGANIWVVNTGSENVTKLRATDGVVLGTFAVGRYPDLGIAFDGTRIWVGNRNGFSVTRLQASDGQNLGEIALPGSGSALAFDGGYIWVGLSGQGITKIRASDGVIVGTFAYGIGYLNGLAFDGLNVWATDATHGRLVKVRASDGTVLGSFPVGTNPVGVAFDGANIWVANLDSASVSKR